VIATSNQAQTTEAIPAGKGRPDAPSPGLRLIDRMTVPWLVLATGLVAAVPVITSMARGLSAGWAPLGDRGIIATRALDVFTSHTPVLGEYSAASGSVHHAAYSPGPLLFWLLALPAHFGPAALTVWMGVINVLSVLGVVWLAHRRGGRPLMFATAIAVALMTRSLTSETWHDILNSAAPLLPFTLLIFVCWSVACGEYRLLPFAVLIASFATQSHLMFALPSLALLIVAVGGLVISRRPARGGTTAPAAESSHPDPPSARRWTLATVVIAVICWIPPLVQEAGHVLGLKPGPGNITLEAKIAFSHAKVGYADGLHALVRAIGIPPWWLRPPRSIPQRLFADVYAAPSALSIASCALILGALLAIVAVAVRRRRVDVTAAGVSALLLAVALVVSTAGTPTAGGGFFTLAYSLWWASPGGMWVWLALGWSALALARPAPLPALRALAIPATAAAFVVVASVAAVVALNQAPDVDRGAYKPIARVTAALRSARPLPGPVLVQVSDRRTSSILSALDLEAAIIYSVRRSRADVRSDHPELVGRAYREGSEPARSIVTVHAGKSLATSSDRVLANLRWTSAGLPAPYRFTVTLGPGTAGAG
jgi:hypothetical protein